MARITLENDTIVDDYDLRAKRRAYRTAYLKHQTQRCLSSTACEVITKILKAVAVTTAFIIVSPFLIAAVLALCSLILSLPVTIPVLLPLCMIVLLSLPRKVKRWIKEDGNDNKLHGVDVLYKKAKVTETMWVRIMWSSFGILARASLVMLAGLALSIWVPRLKRVRLLGSPLWKWSLLSVTLTAGYFEALSLVGIVVLVVVALLDKKSTAAHYIGDLRLHITHVMYMGIVLVSWLVYFGREKGLKQASTPHPQAFEYVTWTIVSLFVGSILSLLKELLLARWSAHAIYRRFEPRILIASVKYFFIGLAAAGFDEQGILDDLKVSDRDNSSRKVASVTKRIMSRKMDLGYLRYNCRILKSLAEIQSPILDQEEEEKEVVNWFSDQILGTTEECTPADLLDLFLSTKEKGKAESAAAESQSFFRRIVNKILKNEPADGAESVVDQSKSFFERILNWMPSKAINNLPFIESEGRRGDEKLEKQRNREKEQDQRNMEMANTLWRLVQEESSSHNFTYDHLKIWMVDAHNDCMNMGRTLVDATGIVSRLDLLMSMVISLIVILMWILLTGSASTAVLVSISTPLLAWTFVFGDTAKTFFQGLIFCFATHPFDVGDRCIFDAAELEVKSVNILTTTFTKIGSKEKRLYPNAVLATKPILNLGWQPNSNDVVELNLISSTNLDDLEQRVKQFFEQHDDKYNNSYHMMTNELGENVKVTIHFSHKLTVHDLSHNQCFKKKNMQRSKLLNMINNQINEQRKPEVVPTEDVNNEGNAQPMPNPKASSENEIVPYHSTSTHTT